MKKTKRKFFISVLILLILFMGLVFLLPTKTNSTKDIVPEKIEKVKEKVKKEKKIAKKEKKTADASTETHQEEENPQTTEPVEAEVVVEEPAPVPKEATSPVVDTSNNNTIVPYPHSDFKTYMYGSAVTNTASAQYQLISRACVGDYGIMMVDGCYLVAMGTAYAHYIGEKYQVTFESGQVINVMIGDVKQNIHTDQYNSAGAANGDLLEFIVAQPPEQVAIMGNYNVVFPGKVAYLTVI